MSTTDSILDNTNSPADKRLCNAVNKWLEANAEQLRQWRIRSSGRRSLLNMEDHELDDIGIERSEALNEAAKPFWKA